MALLFSRRSSVVAIPESALLEDIWGSTDEIAATLKLPKTFKDGASGDRTRSRVLYPQLAIVSCYNLRVAQSHQPLAVYPGSFDPFHIGHVAIVERATQIFPKVVIGILENVGKDSLFSPIERAEMVRELYIDNPAVEVRSFSGLLVEFLKELDATIIIRGMRAVSDFEYEFQMALMNRHLYPPAETVFLTPKEKYTYLSSKLVREVVALGGDVTGLVPDLVLVRLEERFRKKTQSPAS